MEVLETTSTLKEPETKDSSSPYNCRIPRDLNLPNSRKSETDVSLLVACKIQLSSEVIRWKTETLRLQKERDSAQSRARDLDQRMAKLAQKAKELEDRLAHAEDENKHLKSRSVVNDEEKAALVHKLSQSVNKYHSYPCGDTSPKSSRLSRLQVSEFRREEVEPNDDWREVSQKMIQKMKQEMRELDEMNNRFRILDKKSSPETSGYTDCKDDLEEGISSLLSETESLKHHLLEQGQKLRSLLLGYNSSNAFQGHSSIKSEIKDMNSSNDDMQLSAAKTTSPHLSSPENKFSVYYTKQLKTFDNSNKSAKSSPRSPPTCAGSQESGFKREIKSPTPASFKKNAEVRSENVREDKVCPICQMNFDATVSQAQFEEHVLNHLETESTSLLDQYVVL